MNEPSPRRGPPPLSPCIQVCQLAGNTCVGCRRTLAEIAGWWSMSDAQKRAVLAELPQRAPTARD